VVQAMANEPTAALLRAFHPLRFQNWALSHMNPWMAALQPVAQQVRENRRPLAADDPMRTLEHTNAEIYSAMLDHYRGVRDAMTEAGFFSTYANLVTPDKTDASGQLAVPVAADARELPIVRDALASMDHGGYVEALARVAFLLMRQGEPLPLSRLELKDELVPAYEDYLPGMSPHDWRRIRGEQEIIARFEPERALATLPLLLDEGSDRERLVALLDKLMADKRVQATAPSAAQVTMLGRIRKVLGLPTKPARRRTPPRRAVARRA